MRAGNPSAALESQAFCSSVLAREVTYLRQRNEEVISCPTADKHRIPSDDGPDAQDATFSRDPCPLWFSWQMTATADPVSVNCTNELGEGESIMLDDIVERSSQRFPGLPSLSPCLPSA